MLFQALDYKEFCRLFYMDGELYEDFNSSKMTSTWQYSGHLEGLDIEYANLYCKGQSIDSVCPDSLKERWKLLREKKSAYLKSLSISKVNLDDVCIYEMLPERFLKEYCEIKNRITDHVLSLYKRPPNYDFYKELTEVLLDITRNRVKIDNMNPINAEMNNKNNIIKYNIFGTRTGRLTTLKNSFPILTLKKEYRSIILPNNRYFLELDYNSAELRVLYALQRIDANRALWQPEGDIHEWNVKNIFNSKISRQEAKTSIFAWLFNPSSQNDAAEKIYDRGAALRQANWDGHSITNYYGRTIEVDKRRAVNYLLQSTLSDLFLRKKIKIYNMLKDRKSRIAFSVHDSLIIDMSLEDTDLVNDMVQEFANTPFGKFKVNVKVGDNYGNLRKARGF
jgi:hypothetical protein